jgi:hypothetical protein
MVFGGPEGPQDDLRRSTNLYLLRPLLSSTELSHSLQVSDRRRNAPEPVQKRSESLCAGFVGAVPYILGLRWPRARPPRLEVEDSRPDPYKLSGPSQLSRLRTSPGSLRTSAPSPSCWPDGPGALLADPGGGPGWSVDHPAHKKANPALKQSKNKTENTN